MLQHVLIRGEELKPTLNAWAVIAYLGDVFQGLIVGPDLEVCAAQVSTQSFDGPDDGACFEVKWRPVALGVKCRSANEDYGANGAVGLFLLQRGAEAVETRVAMESERSCAVFNGFPVREDENRGFGEFLENLTHDGLHVCGEGE